MTRDNRQILINPHSSIEKVPAGALNLGEIAVQHDSVSGAALYVETVADSQIPETVAKFINEIEINNRIDEAKNDLQIKIDAINESVGLPHTGTTGDTHHWDENTTVWDAIEETYAEMAAGTAAANTKVEKAGNSDTTKYMTLSHVTDQETSSITYTIGLQGIDDAIKEVSDRVDALSGVVESFSANTVHEIETITEKLEELSAATDEALSELDYTGVTPNGQAIVNVTEEDGVITATQGDIAAEHVTIEDAGSLLDAENVEDALQEIAAKVEANEVELVKLNADEIAALQDANVKEAYKLIHSDDSGRTKVGEIVKIYKDSALYSASMGTMGDTIVSPDDPTIVPGTGDTALSLIYYKADGTYEMVNIDVNDFLEESEFADGLQVLNHVVSVKVDGASEEVRISSAETAEVLSVGEDGVKISHIQEAIDYAVQNLAENIDADVTGTSQDGHVTVEVVQTNTELTEVVVTTDDIASETELKTVEESVGLGENGEFETITGYYTESAETVIEAVQAVDNALHELSEKLGDVEVFETGSTENWVTLTVAEVENGRTGLTLDDSALADELIDIRETIEAETTARENADLELLGNSASTSAETSIMGLKELINELTKGVSDDAVQDAEFAVLTDAERAENHCNAGIAVVANGEDGKKVQLDLSLLKVDCGSY